MQIREALFVAGDVVRLSNGPSGMRDLIVEKVLQRMYEDDPALDPASAQSTVSAMRSAVGGVPDAALTVLTPNEQILLLLKTLHGSDFGSLANGAVGGVANDALTDAGAGLPEGQYAVSADALSTLALDNFAPAKVLSDTFALGQQNARFATARDAVWGDLSGETLGMTVAQLEAARALKNVPGVQSTVQGLQSGTTVEAVAGDENNAVTDIQDQTAARINDLADPAKLQADAAAQNEAVNNDTTSMALDEVTLDENKFDKHTGVVVVGAVMQGFFSKLGNFGQNPLNAALVGGLGGGVLSLVPSLESLSGLLGTSPDQAVLEQIAKLSQQIDAFRQETLANFNTVDQGLSNILDEMGAQTALLAQVGANVDSVATNLAEQEASIDQLQSAVYSFISDSSESDLDDALNLYIGYQQHAADGQPMSQADFLTADSFFFTRATQVATSSDWLGSPTGYAQKISVYDRLQAYPDVATNANYLSQAPAGLWGLPPLSPPQTTLPNPEQWAVAARAYSELLLENPSRVTNTQLQRLNEIRAEGDELGSAIRAATQSDTTTGTHSLLFNQLIDDYTNALGKTEQDISSVETEYQDKLPGYDGFGNGTPSQNLTDGSGHPLDLNDSKLDADTLTTDFDNVVDSNSGLANHFSNAGPCNDASTLNVGSYFTTNNVNHITLSQDLYVPGPMLYHAFDNTDLHYYELADRLGIGTLRPCWKTDPGAYSTQTVNPFGTPIVNHYNDLTYELDWRYRPHDSTEPSVTVYSWSYHVGNTLYKSTLQDGTTLTDWGLDGLLEECWNWPGGSQQQTDCVNNAAGTTTGGWPQLWWYLPVQARVQPVEAATATDIANIKADINKQLTGLREQMAGTVAGDVTPLMTDGSLTSAGQLLTDAQNLTGARDLLENYIQFAFAPALGTDGTLRALTEGTRTLRALPELLALFQQAEKTPETDVLAAVDLPEPQQISDLETAIAAHTVPSSGSASVQSGLSVRVASAQAAGASDDPSGLTNELVDSTLYRLELTGPALVAAGVAPVSSVSPPAPSVNPPSPPAPPVTPPSPPVNPPGTPAMVLHLLHAGLQASSFTSRRGTTLTYALNTGGTITITITKTVTSHRRARSCVRTGRGKACQLVVRVRQTQTRGRAGNNIVRSVGRGLPKGTYTLTVAPLAKGANPIVLHIRVR